MPEGVLSVASFGLSCCGQGLDYRRMTVFFTCPFLEWGEGRGMAT